MTGFKEQTKADNRRAALLQDVASTNVSTRKCECGLPCVGKQIELDEQALSLRVSKHRTVEEWMFAVMCIAWLLHYILSSKFVMVNDELAIPLALTWFAVVYRAWIRKHGEKFKKKNSIDLTTVLYYCIVFSLGVVHVVLWMFSGMDGGHYLAVIGLILLMLNKLPKRSLFISKGGKSKKKKNKSKEDDESVDVEAQILDGIFPAQGVHLTVNKVTQKIDCQKCPEEANKEKGENFKHLRAAVEICKPIPSRVKQAAMGFKEYVEDRPLVDEEVSLGFESTMPVLTDDQLRKHRSQILKELKKTDYHKPEPEKVTDFRWFVREGFFSLFGWNPAMSWWYVRLCLFVLSVLVCCWYYGLYFSSLYLSFFMWWDCTAQEDAWVANAPKTEQDSKDDDDDDDPGPVPNMDEVEYPFPSMVEVPGSDPSAIEGSPSLYKHLEMLQAMLPVELRLLLTDRHTQALLVLLAQLGSCPKYLTLEDVYKPEEIKPDTDLPQAVKDANRHNTFHRVVLIASFIMEHVPEELRPVCIGMLSSLGAAGFIAKSSDGTSFKVTENGAAKTPGWFMRIGEILQVSNGVYKDKDLRNVVRASAFMALLPAVMAGCVKKEDFVIWHARVMSWMPDTGDLISSISDAAIAIIRRTNIALNSGNPISTFLNLERNNHESDLYELQKIARAVEIGNVRELVKDPSLYVMTLSNKITKWEVELKHSPTKKVREKLLLAREVLIRMATQHVANGKVVEPLSLLFVGKPGIGKTEWAKIAARKILMIMGIDDPVVAGINVLDKYDSTAHMGVHGFVADDVNKQKMEYRQQGTFPVEVIFKYVSSDPVPIIRAAVDDKGWMYFCHWLVIWTMNSANFTSDATDELALRRRLTHVFYVRLNKEYELPNGQLNIDKCIADGAVEVLEFFPHEWYKNSNGVVDLRPVQGIDGYLTVDQFYAYIKCICDKWLKKREALLETKKLAITMCSHGLPASNCLACKTGDSDSETGDVKQDGGKSSELSAFDWVSSFFVSKSAKSATREVAIVQSAGTTMGWMEYFIAKFVLREGNWVDRAHSTLMRLSAPQNRIFYAQMAVSHVAISVVLSLLETYGTAYFGLNLSIGGSVLLAFVYIYCFCTFILCVIVFSGHKQFEKAVRSFNFQRTEDVYCSMTTFISSKGIACLGSSQYQRRIKIIKAVSATGVAVGLAMTLRSFVRRLNHTQYVAKGNRKSFVDDVLEVVDTPGNKRVQEIVKADEMEGKDSSYVKTGKDYWTPPVVSKVIANPKAVTGTSQHLEHALCSCTVQVKVKASSFDPSGKPVTHLDTCYGIQIDEQVLIMPHHSLVYEGQFSFPSYELVISRLNQAPRTVRVPKGNIYCPRKNKDVAFVKLNVNLSSPGRIIDKFVNDFTPGKLSGYLVEYDGLVPSKQIDITLDGKPDELEYLVNGGEFWKSEVVKGKWHRTLKPGECGMPLRLYQGSSSAVIGGILVAGSETADCFAIVDTGMVLDAFKHFEEHCMLVRRARFEGAINTLSESGESLTTEPYPKSALRYQPENTTVEFLGAIAPPNSNRNNMECNPHAAHFQKYLNVRKTSLPTNCRLNEGTHKVMAYSNNAPAGYDSALMNVVCEAMTKVIEERKDSIEQAVIDSGAPRRPLTLSEAINGIPGTDVSVIKMDTADGMGKKKRDHLEVIPQDGILRLKNKSELEFIEFSEDVLKGINPGYMSKLCSKVETKEVKMTGDPEPLARLFGSANFYTYLMGKQYLEPLMCMAKKIPSDLWTAIGLNVEGDDWHESFEKFATPEYCHNVIELDSKKYDATQSSNLRNCSTKLWIVIAKCCGWCAEDLVGLEKFLALLLETKVSINGEITDLYHYFLSGLIHTAFDNGLRGVIILVYCYCAFIAKRGHSGKELEEKLVQFVRDLLCRTLGDDLLAAVLDKYRDEGFTPSVIQEIANECGSYLTSADKNDNVDWKDFCDSTFLKRRFTYDPFRQHIIGSLTPISFTKSALWCERPKIAPNVHTAELLQNVLRECANIGEEIFNLYAFGKEVIDEGGHAHKMLGVHAMCDDLGINLPDEYKLPYKDFKKWQVDNSDKVVVKPNPGLPTDRSKQILRIYREAPEGEPLRNKFQLPLYIAKSSPQEGSSDDGPVVEADESGPLVTTSNVLSIDAQAAELRSNRFGLWEEREVEIGVATVTVGDGAFLFSVNPYVEFFKDKTMLDMHLAHAYIFSADMKITASWSSSTSHQGEVWMYSVPNTPGVSLELTEDVGIQLNAISCRNFVSIDFSTDDTKAELIVPFIANQPMVPLIESRLQELATVNFRSVFPLAHIMGITTPIVIKIRAKLINPKFGTSTTYIAKSLGSVKKIRSFDYDPDREAFYLLEEEYDPNVVPSELRRRIVDDYLSSMLEETGESSGYSIEVLRDECDKLCFITRDYIGKLSVHCSSYLLRMFIAMYVKELAVTDQRKEWRTDASFEGRRYRTWLSKMNYMLSMLPTEEADSLYQCLLMLVLYLGARDCTDDDEGGCTSDSFITLEMGSDWTLQTSNDMRWTAPSMKGLSYFSTDLNDIYTTVMYENSLAGSVQMMYLSDDQRSRCKRAHVNLFCSASSFFLARTAEMEQDDWDWEKKIPVITKRNWHESRDDLMSFEQAVEFAKEFTIANAMTKADLDSFDEFLSAMSFAPDEGRVSRVIKEYTVGDVARLKAIEVEDISRNKVYVSFCSNVESPGLCYLNLFLDVYKQDAYDELGWFPTVKELLRYCEKFPADSLCDYLAGCVVSCCGQIIHLSRWLTYISGEPDPEVTLAKLKLMPEDGIVGVEMSGNPPAQSSWLAVLCVFVANFIFELYRRRHNEEDHWWDVESNTARRQGDWRQGDWRREPPRYKAKSKQVIEGDTGEKMSSKLSKFSELMSALRPAMSYMPYGTLVSDFVKSVSGSAAGVLYHYGYSRPLNTSATSHVPSMLLNLANSNGEHLGSVLTLDRFNETPMNVPQSGGSDVDTLSFAFLKEKITVIQTFMFDDSQEQNSVLTVINVGPNYVITNANQVEGGLQSGDRFYLPPMGQVAAVTGLWHGPMHYVVEFNCAASIRGKVRIDVDYHNGQEFNPTVQNSKIIDIQKDKAYSFVVHNQRETNALRTFGSSENPRVPHPRGLFDPLLHSARISIRVYDRPTGPGLISPQVGVKIWACCGASMQFLDTSCVPLMDYIKPYDESFEFSGTLEPESVSLTPPAQFPLYSTLVNAGSNIVMSTPPREYESAPTQTPGTTLPTSFSTTFTPSVAPFISPSPTVMPNENSTILPTVNTVFPTGANATLAPTGAPTVMCEARDVDVPFPPGCLNPDGTLRHAGASRYRIMMNGSTVSSEGVFIEPGTTAKITVTTYARAGGELDMTVWGTYEGATAIATSPNLSVSFGRRRKLQRTLGHWTPMTFSSTNFGQAGHVKAEAEVTAGASTVILHHQTLTVPGAAVWTKYYADSLSGGVSNSVPNPDSGDTPVRSYDRKNGEFLSIGPTPDNPELCSGGQTYAMVVWSGNRSVGFSMSELGTTLTTVNGEAIWSNTRNGKVQFVNEIIRIGDRPVLFTGGPKNGEQLHIFCVCLFNLVGAKSEFGQPYVPESLASNLVGEQILSMRTLLNAPTFAGTLVVETKGDGLCEGLIWIDPYNPVAAGGFSPFHLLRNSFYSLRGGMVMSHLFLGEDDCAVSALTSFKCKRMQDLKMLHSYGAAAVDSRVNPSITVKCPYKSEVMYYLIIPKGQAPVVTSHAEYIRVMTSSPKRVYISCWFSTAEDFNFMYYMRGSSLTLK